MYLDPPRTKREHIPVAGDIPISRRKGELSPAGIDRGWPFQVALPSDKCHYKDHDTPYGVQQGLVALRAWPLGIYQDSGYNVFCYADKADAEAFTAEFGGEWFDPRERGRCHAWYKWYRGKFTPPGEFPKPAPKKGRGQSSINGDSDSFYTRGTILLPKA